MGSGCTWIIPNSPVELGFNYENLERTERLNLGFTDEKEAGEPVEAFSEGLKGRFYGLHTVSNIKINHRPFLFDAEDLLCVEYGDVAFC